MRTNDILETAEYIIRFVEKMKREKDKLGYYDGGNKKKEDFVIITNIMRQVLGLFLMHFHMI